MWNKQIEHICPKYICVIYYSQENKKINYLQLKPVEVSHLNLSFHVFHKI